MHPCCQPRRSGNKAFSQFFLEKIALSAQDRPPRRRVPRKAAAGPALVRSFNHNGMTDAGTRSLGKPFGRKAIINRLKETDSHVPYKYNIQQIQIKK